jgi:hypothetical protein
MALYELLLLGQGRPQLRLTYCVLAADVFLHAVTLTA